MLYQCAVVPPNRRLPTHLQGEFCARRPIHVIVGGVVLIAFCLLGLIRFKLETNPQQLWVGPGSRAAQDKARYEASFGPFYRVSQLIVSTTPETPSAYVSTTGLPAIVSNENIKLLWEMQAKVDAISGEFAATRLFILSYGMIHLLALYRVQP